MYNTVIGVIESAIHEIQILPNASGEHKDSCEILYRDIHKSADLTAQELYWSFFLCKDLKPPPPNCNTWIKYWKCFEQTKILFNHLLPMVFAFVASLKNQFRRGMLMVTVLWTALHLLSQMAFQLIFPP